jgi:hypothetical protein
VPDGTTALVRCPACKTVFSPDGNAESDRPEAEKPKAPARSPRTSGSGVTRLPKAGAPPKASVSPNDANRDFDPITEEEEKERKRRRKKRRNDGPLTPEEKAERRQEFRRGAIGALLIWISFALYMLSMALILIYFFESAFLDPMPGLITAAGVIGLLNWVLAAVGVGMCLSAPRVPGHLMYGISAAVAVLLHLLMVLVLCVQGKEFGITKTDAAAGNARWALIPTRVNATMFYLTAALYPDNEEFAPRGGRMPASAIVGVLEMTRTVLILMLLSCLARAALDDDLAHRCTRVAGLASVGPGLLAALLLVFVAVATETGLGMSATVRVLYTAIHMGAYAIAMGVVFPALMVARDVNDACDEPYQSLIPQR